MSAKINNEQIDLQNPNLESPGASHHIGEYVEAGSVVPLANFDLRGDAGPRVAHDGSMGRLVESPEAGELFDAMEKARQIYGAANISDGAAYDRELGKVREDVRARGMIGVYVTSKALEEAEAKGQKNPFTERPYVAPPKYNRVLNRVTETRNAIRYKARRARMDRHHRRVVKLEKSEQ